MCDGHMGFVLLLYVAAVYIIPCLALCGCSGKASRVNVQATSLYSATVFWAVQTACNVQVPDLLSVMLSVERLSTFQTIQ